ncbi:MAG: SigE family RNA polymerase sigma factor [Actinobacteria bacterium]|nr:SigE family RNA polymerase sigma factor [Actinomycetota bacterium]
MRTRDRDAEFHDFYVAEVPRLRSIALMLTADPSAADDLVQEALLRCYRKWHRIRDEDPGPYVRRTLTNLYRNDIRKNIVRRKHPPDAQKPEPSHAGSVEDALRVGRALQDLSPIRRAVVILRYYEDLPERAIAEILDRPLGTVKSDLHRALATLKPLLEDDPVKEIR